MSVFTQLTLRPTASGLYEVLMANPWYEPNIQHKTHLVPHLDSTTATLFLRIPFYDPLRPRIGEPVNLSELPNGQVL